MHQTLDEFEANLARFQVRASRLAANVLAHVEEDADERAAMTLLLMGTLEGFLRDAVRDCVRTINERQIPFADLHIRIQESHFREGAKVLERVAREDREVTPGKSPVTWKRSIDLCSRLASVGSDTYELVWEGFARTESNAGPDQVSKLLKRLGVDDPWATMEASMPIDIEDVPPGNQRVAYLKATLNSLLDARNRSAHGGDRQALPAWSSIEGFVVVLQAVAYGFIGALEKAHLA